MLPDGAHNWSLETTFFMIRWDNVDSTDEFNAEEKLKSEEAKTLVDRPFLWEDFFKINQQTFIDNFQPITFEVVKLYTLVN